MICFKAKLRLPAGDCNISCLQWSLQVSEVSKAGNEIDISDELDILSQLNAKFSIEGVTSGMGGLKQLRWPFPELEDRLALLPESESQSQPKFAPPSSHIIIETKTLSIINNLTVQSLCHLIEGLRSLSPI